MNNSFARDRMENEKLKRENEKLKRENENTSLLNNPVSEVIRLFYYFLTLLAAYVCFKINKGFSWSIILAVLFSPIYLVYAYAQHGKKIFKF